MDRFWLAQYPPGTPTDIDINRWPSIKALVEDSFQRFTDRTAFSQMGRTVSYGELDRLSAGFAAWLQDEGFKKGDRLAIMLPNVLQYPVAILGALRAGLVVVNCNPLYTAPELEHQLNDSGATAILVLENFAHTVQAVAPRTRLRTILITGAGDLLQFPRGALVNFVLRHVKRAIPAWSLPGSLNFKQVMKRSAGRRPTDVALSHDDIAFLQYTGGTTGVSKGAMLTHGNLVANVLQAQAWFTQIALDHTRYICALPLYHIFSLTTNCLLFMALGGTGVLIANPRDFPRFVEELRRNPPMFVMGVNTLFNALMNTRGFESVDFSQMVATMGGGMAVQRAVAERWKKMTGCKITQGWGLTETSPVACVNPLVGPDSEFNGSVGLPFPGTEISIRDDDGKEVGVEISGEICVRGPQVMRGYWNRPDETSKVMLPEGWLRTGDIGRIDSRGFVYIEDRKKDMIVVSGFKVFPNEVEEVVAHMPGVKEVAAVGLPDSRSGEVVVLFVVRQDPSLTEEAIRKLCEQQLTGYKQPRRVYFRTELPKTNVGKILRRSLRDELIKSSGAS
jgi:long-chain acyl-CoA synthetase